MDFFRVIFQVIVDFWYLLLLLIILVFITIPLLKGWACLCIVNLFACLLLNKNKYHPFTNIVLPSEYGAMQIDHIIVSNYGVFVVEMTKIKGWIFGNANEQTWTQKIYKQTNKFQNPLHLNYNHVKELKTFLGLKDNQIHSVVLFGGGSILNTNMPENVTQGIGFIRFIKTKTQQVLTDLEVMEIKLKIIDLRLERSLETKRKHPENIKNIVRIKES